MWKTLPDLKLQHLDTTKVGSRSRLILDIANVGLSSSRPTSLAVRDADVVSVREGPGKPVLKAPKKILISTLPAGKHVQYIVDVVPRNTSVQLTIAQNSELPEQGYDNNAATVYAATGRGGIVTAALAGAARPKAVKFDDSTLAATNDGALRHVHLPKLPRTATSTGFATWCYYAAGAADPNQQHYLYPSQRFLRRLGKAVPAPAPGDLVFFTSADLGPAVAVYVGDGDAVTFVNKHLARVSLRALGQNLTYRTYLKQ